MDNYQNAVIDDLRNKIRVLISLFEKSKHEKLQLLTENVKLSEQVQLKQKEIDNYEEKLNALKFAKSVVVSSEDKHEAKIKVNRIVREIDKCIALLNR